MPLAIGFIYLIQNAKIIFTPYLFCKLNLLMFWYPTSTFEQLDIQLIFKHSDMVADGWLGQMLFACSFSKSEIFRCM